MIKENMLTNPRLDVLLISPPFSRLRGNPNIFFPLGIGYLASALRNICSVKIYNMEDALDDVKEELTQRHRENLAKHCSNVFNSAAKYKHAIESGSHFVWSETRSVFIKYRPKIIGISCMSATYPAALKIAQIYKDCVIDGCVILGGQHPTIEAEKVCSSENIDFVVRGEGEETIREIVPVILNKSSVPNDFTKIRGISFKKGNSIIHAENRDFKFDLDKLDFPARDLLLKPMKNKEAYGTIITSRGCPFDCTFCSAKAVVGRKARFRSIQNVIDEIKNVKNEYKIKNFFLWDDTFTANRNRAIEMVQAIRKLDINWSCTTRVDTVDYGLLKEMKKAGCISIDYGVESGSESLLPKINKNITKAIINEALTETIRAGIIPNAFLMVGFPDETESDIKNTIAFAKTTKAFTLCLSVFTPYPGTALYKRVNELGLIKNDFDWCNFSHQSFSNLFTQYVSRDKFIFLLNELISMVDKHNASWYKKLLRILIIAINNPKYILRKLVLY